MAAQNKGLDLKLFGNKKKGSKPINLLPKEEFAASTKGRILTWILSTFKTIVIVTEMIIMTAFFSRFWLDAKSSDLNEEIRTKQAVLAASKEFEDEFKNVQKKLKIISELSEDSLKPQEILSYISSMLPQDIYINSFSLNEKTIQIKGVSPSEKSIAQFIVNLDGDDSLGEPSLNELGTAEDQTSLLTFGIVINLEKKGK